MTGSNTHRLAAIMFLLTLTVMDRPRHGVFGTVLFRNNSDDNQDSFFGFFDAPYTNMAFELSESVTGNVYYSDVLCTDIFRRPSSPYASTNGSILLLDSFEECTVRRVALAKQAGYDAVLFHANKSIRFSDDIVSLGFPVALIDSNKARLIKDSLSNSSDDYTQYTVSVSGTLLIGILIVVFSCCVGSACCYCSITCCIVCCVLCMGDSDTQTRNARNRDELVESFLRRLQEIEEAEGRIPYGKDRAKALPVKVYRKKEDDTNCAVCVDDIEDGDSVKLLPCGHMYHVKCIDEWLCTYSSLCPLCKYNLQQAPPTATESTPLSATRSTLGGSTF